MLEAKRVNEMFLDCLFKPEEIVNDKPIVEPVIVEGIPGPFGFHPERIKTYREELIGMIGELNLNYLPQNEGGGGGWSFLNLCYDKNDRQWADFQKTMNEFFCLCAGNGLARTQFPRDMWNTFPGEVPYVEFTRRGFPAETKETQPSSRDQAHG